MAALSRPSSVPSAPPEVMTSILVIISLTLLVSGSLTLIASWMVDGVPMVATYVGVPDDADLQYRAGVVSLPGGADVWALGDHGVRCYLWLDGSALSASLNGAGVDGLPIQYK